MSTRRQLRGVWLGRRPYRPVFELQRDLLERRRRGAIGDTLLLLEHDPVVTLGKGASASNLLASDALLAARGVERVETDRGGDVTLHAPGQLVGYPIVDLAPDRCDVRRYVGDLAEVMRRIADRRGVASGTVDGLIGLWVDRRHPRTWDGAGAADELAKIGAIGVRVSRWITMHGFAINLSTDLSLFDLIVPCGIQQHGVASVASLGGGPVDLRAAADEAQIALAEVLRADGAAVEDHSDAPLTEAFPRL